MVVALDAVNALRPGLPGHRHQIQVDPAKGKIIFFFVFFLFTIESSTATLTVLVMTMIIPLSALCFTQAWIMGPYVESLTAVTLVSLVVVILGILVYRFLRWNKFPLNRLFPPSVPVDKTDVTFDIQGSRKSLRSDEGTQLLTATSDLLSDRETNSVDSENEAVLIIPRVGLVEVEVNLFEELWVIS